MSDDRGTTLVEVVVGLFLVAMAAALLAALMTSTARSAPDDTIGPDPTLAVDTFSRDVRGADHVTAESRRGRLIAVTLVSDTGSVRWSFQRDELIRADDAAARAMAVGVDNSSTFALRDSAGAVIAANDADAVRWCTRLAEISLVGDDWDVTRSIALRVDTAEGRCS